ncbi:MAG: glycine cleavage T C-terminal barrel domain-containing protein [Anaerolineales bacterium]|nr:glycine cleavage T C-terminal barrel domain-containing protein [Anaerolineales bacterium]
MIPESSPYRPDENENAAYQAAREGAVYTLGEQCGALEIGGRDQVEFLHNKTANDLHLLTPTHSVLSPLLTPTARLRDVLRVLQRGEALWALTLPGRGGGTLAFLRSQLFFRDQVSLTDRSHESLQIDLDGPGAHELVQQLGLVHPVQSDEVAALRFDGEEVVCIGQPGLNGRGVKLLAPAHLQAGLLGFLKAESALPLSPDLYDLLRIEAGLPGPRGELTQDYTPLEVGLESAVSAAKGCYTGQEVLARQRNYDKIVQGLAGLAFAEPAQTGASLWSQGHLAGKVTSTAQSPRFGAIGLGVVRRERLTPGTTLNVGAAQSNVTARVVALPFDQAAREGA